MKLKAIKKLKGLGLFNNYQWNNTLHDFGRYNLIYGWNDSGKTTLSKLFECLEDGNSPKFYGLEYDIEHESTTAKEKIRTILNFPIITQY